MAGSRERGERLQIMLTPEELTGLDDFRFKNRMPSSSGGDPGNSATRPWRQRGGGSEGRIQVE